MTRKQLDQWVKSAWWSMLSEYAVPFVAAEHPAAPAIACKWIAAKQPAIACSGWNTYALTLAVRPDSELDLAEIVELMTRVELQINTSPDRVRYCMNGFVISVASYVKPLLSVAKQTARSIGTISVDMGNTACKVPVAIDAIKKIESMNRIGLKRKTTKC
jgi:hypothetical protein